MTIDQAEIDRRFDLHTPTDQDVRDTLDSIRADFKRLATVIIGATGQAPREQALAITHLEDSLAATIGAIVRPAPAPPSWIGQAVAAAGKAAAGDLAAGIAGGPPVGAAGRHIGFGSDNAAAAAEAVADLGARQQQQYAGPTAR